MPVAVTWYARFSKRKPAERSRISMIASAPDRQACFLSSGIADSRSPWAKPVRSMCTSNRETRSKTFCGLRLLDLESGNDQRIKGGFLHYGGWLSENCRHP